MYADNYRVISAFRFSEPECFVRETSLQNADASKNLLKDLFFKGFDYKDYTEFIMNELGSDYNDLNKYKFGVDSELKNNPEWKRFSMECWPKNSEKPLFAYQINFYSYDVSFVSDNFMVFFRKWLSIPSDTAHELFGESYSTVDLQNRKIQGLDDIFILQTLEKLDKDIRLLLHKKKIYLDELYPITPKPDSFIFDKSGIRLIWQPYSMFLSYKKIVSVILPFKDIEKYLTEEGLRLMQVIKINSYKIKESK